MNDPGPEPLSSKAQYANIDYMEDEELAQVRLEVDTYLKKGMITPDGRKELEVRLHDIDDLIKYRKDVEEMRERYQP